MNICMVGYGAIAEKHMEALCGIDGVHPQVLVGRRPEPTAEFAAQWGFAHHTLNLDEALSDNQVDAVVITSPNDLHVPQAGKAIEADKHVLLEIPIALNIDDARRITALSRRNDKRFMVCHSMRYMPTMLEVRRRVQDGQLRLHQIIAFFGIMRRSNTSWTGRVRSWTDNILWHHAAHLVDIAMWLSGTRDASDVDCRFGPLHPTQGVMDLNLSMVLPGDLLVSIAESYNFNGFRWRVLFVGEEATFEFDECTLRDSDGKVVVPQHAIVDLRAQNEEFVASVREGRDPAITGEEVLPAMEVIQMAQHSGDAEG